MGVFADSLVRGADQTQAMLYGFASVIGDAFGVNALKEWGEEGTLRNLAEAAENPPRVESFDDINSLADVGDYALEALGENATSLLAMLLPAAGAGSLAARYGAHTVAKATLGKALRQQVGEEAFQRFAKERARRIAAASAAGGVSFGLNTGETYVSLDQEGVADGNAGTAIVSGALKSALDVFGLQRIMTAARATGVTPKDFLEYADDVLAHTRMSATAEGATEGLQTIVDMAAVASEKPEFDFFDSENLKDIVNATLKGGIAGGTFGGAGHAIANFQEYRAGARAAQQELGGLSEQVARHREALDAFTERLIGPAAPAAAATEAITPPFTPGGTGRDEEQRTLDEDSLPWPESAQAILSQVQALVDPNNSKRAVLVTPGSTLPDTLPEGVEATSFASKDGNNNLLLTYDPEITAAVRSKKSLTEGDLGELLYDRPAGKDVAGEPLTVRGSDDAGNTVAEVVSDENTVEQDAEAIAEQAPEVRVERVEDTLNRRIAEINAEATGREVPQEVPDVMGFVKQLPPTYQQEITAIVRGSSERARETMRALTQTVEQGEAKMAEVIAAARREEAESMAAEDEASRGELGRAEDVNSEVDQELAARVATVPEEVTLRGNGYSSAEIAERQLAELNQREPDPNTGRDILEQNGRFFIRETRISDPALRPEDTGATAVAQARGSRRLTDSATGQPLAREEGASESRIVNLTLQKARSTGKDRAKLHRQTQDAAAKQRVRDSYIDVVNPSGTIQPLTVGDLVTGGRELLTARGQRDGENSNLRDNDALTTMLGELAARGYDVSSAFDERGNLRRRIITRGNDLVGDSQAKRSAPIKRVSSAPRKNGDLKREERPKGMRKDTFTEEVPGYVREARENVRDAKANFLKARDKGQSTVDAERQVTVAEAEYDKAVDRYTKSLEEVGASVADIEGADNPNNIVTEEEAPKHTGADRSREEVIEEARRKARARMISARITSLSQTSANGQVTSWGKTITQAERDFVEAVMREAGVTDVPIRIVDEGTLKGALGAALLGPQWAPHIRQRFKDNPGLAATTFNTRSGPMIVIRNGKENPTADDKARKLLILGHEAGHQILQAAWANLKQKPGIQKRLRAAYEKDIADTPVQQWLGASGIKEWFADKVAARARVISNRPRNAVDKVFRDVAKTIQKYWNALKKNLPARFKYNRSFDAAMREMKNEEVFDTSALFFDTPVGREEDIVIDTSQMKDHVSRATLKEARDAMKEFINGLSGLPGVKYLFSVDQRLRAMSPELADMLYQQSSTERQIESYHGAVSYQRNKWMGGFFRLMREHAVGKDDAYIRKAFDEAGSDAPTTELKTELAKAVRTFLRDYYNDYLSVRLPSLGFTENYFPRSYNRSAIAARRPEFEFILKKHGVDNAVKIANVLRMKETTHRFDSPEEMFEGWQLERTLVDKPDMIEELIKEGFLNTNPIGGLQAYIYDTTRKAEWDRLFAGTDENTGSYSPDFKLRQTIASLPKEQQAEATRLAFLSVYPMHGDPNNWWHRQLSELKAYESFRVLLMSGVASIPEMAGLILRTKGQLPFGEIREHVLNTVTNYAEAKEVAEAMGMVRDAIGESMATEIYFDPMMEDGKGFFRKHLPYLFRWNGNDFIVNFSRTTGVALGRAFLVTTSRKARAGDETAARMLRELGVTDPQSIARWEELGFTPSAIGLSKLDAEAVDMALGGLTRFIDESVIHPNASERPSWAGHPVGGLIFHLKSFAMTYNKVVMEGAYREMEARLDKGGVKEGVAYLPFMMAAFGIFVLAGAISDELRNRILSLGEEGTVGKHNGDPGAMLAKWVDRAGFMSQPYNDALLGKDFESLAYTMGPTSHHVYEIFFESYGDDSTLKKILKSIPGLSQAPEIRGDVYEQLAD